MNDEQKQAHNLFEGVHTEAERELEDMVAELNVQKSKRKESTDFD